MSEEKEIKRQYRNHEPIAEYRWLYRRVESANIFVCTGCCFYNKTCKAPYYIDCLIFSPEHELRYHSQKIPIKTDLRGIWKTLFPRKDHRAGTMQGWSEPSEKKFKRENGLPF